MEERRSFVEGLQVQMRTGTGTTGTGSTITGFGIVFEKWSQDLGGFFEVIKREAVNGIDFTDVVSLFNHDSNNVIGRVPDTMTVQVEDYGVRYTVDLPNSPNGQNVREAVKRKDVKGSSFGFQIAPDGDLWEKLQSGMWKRTITKFKKIFDISPVVFPAYLPTSIDLKSIQRQNPDFAKIEREAKAKEENFRLRHELMRLKHGL